MTIRVTITSQNRPPKAIVINEHDSISEAADKIASLLEAIRVEYLFSDRTSGIKDKVLEQVILTTISRLQVVQHEFSLMSLIYQRRIKA